MSLLIYFLCLFLPIHPSTYLILNFLVSFINFPRFIVFISIRAVLEENSPNCLFLFFSNIPTLHSRYLLESLFLHSFSLSPTLFMSHSILPCLSCSSFFLLFYLTLSVTIFEHRFRLFVSLHKHRHLNFLLLLCYSLLLSSFTLFAILSNTYSVSYIILVLFDCNCSDIMNKM